MAKEKVQEFSTGGKDASAVTQQVPAGFRQDVFPVECAQDAAHLLGVAPQQPCDPQPLLQPLAQLCPARARLTRRMHRGLHGKIQGDPSRSAALNLRGRSLCTAVAMLVPCFLLTLNSEAAPQLRLSIEHHGQIWTTILHAGSRQVQRL